MTDEIQPALTPEEWKAVVHYKPGVVIPRECVMWLEDDGKLHIDTTIGEYQDVPFDPAPIMALANAALPDDDPRKITRDDVEWLRLLAGNHTIDFNELQQWAESLRARLAALLPPDE